MPFTEEKLAVLLRAVRATVARETRPIPTFKFREEDIEIASGRDPGYDDSAWADFHVGDFWGGYDQIAWFRATVPIPAHLKDRKLTLRFLVGPRDGGGSTAETMLYVNGDALQGIDIWHESAWLPPEHVQNDSLHVALRSWSGVLAVPDRRRFKVAELNWIDEAAEHVSLVAGTMLDAAKGLDQTDWRRVQIIAAVDQAFRLIDFSTPRSDAYYASIAEAAASLDESLADLATHESGKPTITAVGHAHIDMAWLWRLSHSREKATRTFATALHLMRQYPDYRFMHSSPQLYKFLQMDAPDLFERVKERIAAGQWEITGGMWIEPDTNLTSGESLVRQLIYGKRYIRETFGVDSTVLWLPDVFGFTYALPQIMAKSGMKYLLTSKLSWNQFNRFPHDTFTWRGLDGSEVLVQFMTTPEGDHPTHHTYNGVLSPYEVKGAWDNYQSKTVNADLLATFGWGDGGGGPTPEMIESGRVLRNLPGFPSVRMDHVEPYFARLEERVKDKTLPVWDGELYLEYHRGTYTSQAQIKRANRQAEILYHNAEWVSALADILTGESAYPDLREGWELLLLNQFHDILPGSSIHPVYEDAAIDHARIQAIGHAALDAGIQRIAGSIRTATPSLVVFNPLSWHRANGIIELPLAPGQSALAIRDSEGRPAPTQVVNSGESVLLQIPYGLAVPAFGYATYPLIDASDTPSESTLIVKSDYLENEWYQIRLNHHGQIVSLLDKDKGREVLAPGARGNVFQAFQDRPMEFDAWDIDIYYQEKMDEVTGLVEAVVEETGPIRGTLRLTWRFRASTITLRLSIYHDSRRIDFRTEVDWHEQQTLLKVAFPVNVRSTHATYDIQFGSIERPTHWNTSWDMARFEVPAQKWADLSEGNYGVALLNDCKYGYDIKDNVIRLTLIKSPIAPDPQADQGRHVFTYSLLPHKKASPLQAARAAYDLKLPLFGTLVPAQPNGTLPAHKSLVATGKHGLVETIKQAEDGDGWIVRVYEHRRYRASHATLTFCQPITRAVETNLLEEGDAPVSFEGNTLTFPITPFEIKTFRVWF